MWYLYNASCLSMVCIRRVRSLLAFVVIHNRGEKVLRGMSVKADGADETLAGEFAVLQEGHVVWHLDSLHVLPVVVHFGEFVAVAGLRVANHERFLHRHVRGR